MSGQTSNRVEGYDLLRGLAVFTMLWANLGGYVVTGPFPLWARIAGSFAAPLFLALLGAMIAVNQFSSRPKGFDFYLQRTGILLFWAVFADLIVYAQLPFQGFDVLYVLAYGSLLAFALRSLSLWLRFGVIAAHFILTGYLRNLLGYEHLVQATPLWLDWSFDLKTSLKALAVDGWFPFFPWAGYPVLGYTIYEAIIKYQASKWLRPAAWLGLVIAIIFYALNPGQQLYREEYFELFYPPEAGYILLSTSVVAVSFIELGRIKTAPLMLRPVILLGQCSLLLYLAHNALIQYFFKPVLGAPAYGSFASNPWHFVGCFGLLVLLMWLLSYVVSVNKQKLKNLPSLFATLF